MASTAADVKHDETFANDPVSVGGTVATEPAVYEKDEIAKQNQAAAAAAAETTTAGASKEEKVGENETKVTALPITSGILGYKAPGLLTHLRFSKKFFYLSDDSVDVKDLNLYLRGEKAEVAHPNVAYASQTGKGLLFFVKREEDKKTPGGILNLADASDIAKEGANDFSFKIQGHKHDFQAPTTELRNGWLVAVEAAAEKGKAAREEILGSDGYKASLSSLTKPAHQAAPAVAAGAATATGAGAAAAVVASEEKKDGAEKAEEKKEEKKDEKLAKPQPKSRSVSRNNNKRASIFGGLLGKKDEEKKEEKKEEKVEEPAAKTETPVVEPVKEEATKDETVAGKVEDKPETHGKPAEAAPLAAAAVGGAVVATGVEAEKKEEEPKATDSETADKTASQKAAAPKDKKRTSIFGSLFSANKSPSPTREKKESEATPVIKEDAPAVTTEASKKDAAGAADVLPAPAAATEPSTAEIEKPAGDATVVTTDAKKSGLEKAADVLPAPAAATDLSKAEKADKRRSMFGLGSKSGDKKDEKSTGGKLTEIFRRPSKAAAKSPKEKATGVANVHPAAVAEKEEEASATDIAPNTVPTDKAAEPTVAGAEVPALAGNEAAKDGNVIGDVVPEAVSVGQTNGVSNEVHATA